MTTHRTIDVNCDLGEGHTPGERHLETQLMDIVTSVNVACGVHAGSAAVMRQTVRLAHARGLAIGAHPGLADREHKGRREQALSPDFARELVAAQVSDLLAICRTEGARLTHVKPHGALYNMAAGDPALADAVAAGIAQIGPQLVLIGLAGSQLLRAGRAAAGVTVAAEGFADRAYRPDGQLVARHLAGALIEEETAVVSRARSLILHGTIQAIDGSLLQMHIDTLCLHSDTAGAVRLAFALRKMLKQEGITVQRLPHAG